MLRVVLLRPVRAENVGAIARAMKNFGVTDWVAVNPPALDRARAREVATHAGELVDALRIVDTLDGAIGDCVWVVGTSPRMRAGVRRLGPREVGRQCAERVEDGRVAVVFGDESSGLRNDEIERMHAISALPTDPSQPSVNLAQAVLLYLYEYRQAAIERSGEERALLPRAADDADIERLHAFLGDALEKSRFLHGQGEDVVTELLGPWRRSRLTKREATLWTAVLGNLRKKL